MVASLREARRGNVIAALAIAALGTVGAFAGATMGGTKTGALLAALAVFGPALLYGALTSPIAFPLVPYIVLVPFDNLLSLESFGTVTRLLALAAGAAMLFYMLRTRRHVAPPDVLVVWVLYYLWLGATTFWAIDSKSSLDLLPTAVQLVLFYAVGCIFPMDLRRLRTVVAAVILGGLSAAIYGSYLFKSGTAVGLGGRLWLRSDTGYIDPNHFSAALILPLALCLVGVLWSRRLIARVAFGAASLVLLAGMVFSASRGALLGVVALIAFLLIVDKHRRTLAAMSAAVLVFVFAIQTSLLTRFATAFSSGGAGRVDIWKVGVHAAGQSWLIGAGYGNFPFAYDRAFLQAFQLHYAAWHRAPHNLLLGTTVELGIVGLALLLLAWFGHWRLLSGIREDDARYPLRIALQGALIATLVAAQFLDVMITKYVWLTFMLVVFVRNAQTETRPNV